MCTVHALDALRVLRQNAGVKRIRDITCNGRENLRTTCAGEFPRQPPRTLCALAGDDGWRTWLVLAAVAVLVQAVFLLETTDSLFTSATIATGPVR
jgi:hypothetical protein